LFGCGTPGARGAIKIKKRKDNRVCETRNAKKAPRIDVTQCHLMDVDGFSLPILVDAFVFEAK
jgi:hypothetical protein